MILKEKLLNTKVFIDNAQLDSYISIITKQTTSSKYTEKHHIIPRVYFKINKQKIDNSSDNIVRLSYLDHILAHYYLSFCTIGKLKQANISAFIMLVETGLSILTENEIQAIEHIKEYAAIKEQVKLIRQQQCSKIGKLAKTKAHRQALSKARDLHSTTAGKKSIYNKELNKVKFVAEEDIQSYINNGWVIGGKPLSKEAKEKIGRSNSIALKGKTHQPKQPNKLNSGLTFNKVMCIETGQIFENIELAKQWLKQTVGIDGGQIKNCCAGQRETTGGYHWKYIKED